MTRSHPKDLKNFVLIASLLFMIIGTGSVYFLVVALKLISTEFQWPRAVPSFAYALQYFGAGFGVVLRPVLVLFQCSFWSCFTAGFGVCFAVSFGISLLLVLASFKCWFW